MLTKCICVLYIFFFFCFSNRLNCFNRVKTFTVDVCGTQETSNFVPKSVISSVKKTAASLKRARSESRSTSLKRENRSSRSVSSKSNSKHRQLPTNQPLASYHSDSNLPALCAGSSSSKATNEEALSRCYSNIKEAHSLVRALNILTEHGKKQRSKAAYVGVGNVHCASTFARSLLYHHQIVYHSKSFCFSNIKDAVWMACCFDLRFVTFTTHTLPELEYFDCGFELSQS